MRTIPSARGSAPRRLHAGSLAAAPATCERHPGVATAGTTPTTSEETAINSEITVVLTGRNVEKPDLYRPHVTDRLSRVERYDRHVTRYEVELDHEQNPRQAKTCQHVAITGRTDGRTVRAEASGPDFHTAIDAAVGRLEERLRRTDDRRRVRHDRRSRTATGGVRA